MKRARRGSVLLQVMILGIIVAFLAAGMASMLLMRGSATERIAEGNQGGRTDAGALSNLIYYWNAGTPTCGNTPGVCNPVPGYALSLGNWCTCSCELTNGAVDVVVRSSGGTWPTCQSAISVTQ